jgi:hypothetical protein
MESLTVTANGCATASRSLRSSLVLRALGMTGLVGIVVTVLLVAAGAASGPGRYVPARSGGWPGWLAGPLSSLHVGLSSGRFQALTLIMCACFLLVLLAARALPTSAIAAGILGANLALLLGPPLISQDVFGYLGFARLGVLHGLDPYTHVAAEAPTDAVFPFLGWPLQHSPYGPLFTLGSYALVPLGLAGGLWALKLIASAGSLAAVALTALAARREGRSGRRAAVFVGLNPVLLELALGGAHNDLLVLTLLAGALALYAGSMRSSADANASARIPAESVTQRTRGEAVAPGMPGEAATRRMRAATVALVVGVGVKASAGLVLPFLLLSPGRWGERARLTIWAVGVLAVLVILAVVGFGAHALGFLGALREQQQLVATHSIPAETARWVGLHGLPSWWRNGFLLVFVAVVALTLWRTARGADWRAMAGWAMLALLLSSAWLLPWYAIWLLPLATASDSRRLRIATLAFCAYAILIHLPLAAPVLSSAPAALVLSSAFAAPVLSPAG